MAFVPQTLHRLRHYSTQLPRDPHYKLKATLMTGYLVSAFTLPFVPPVLETRRRGLDHDAGGSDLRRDNAYCSSQFLGRPH